MLHTAVGTGNQQVVKRDLLHAVRGNRHCIGKAVAIFAETHGVARFQHFPRLTIADQHGQRTVVLEVHFDRDVYKRQLLFQGLMDWFFNYVLLRGSEPWYMLLHLTLPNALYTLILSPLLYGLTRLIAHILRKRE